jgi:phenylpropionate dioxygenase-like ring-hydroxylating dioxygenase large terminal subunit
MNREFELSVTEYVLKLVEGRTSDLAESTYEVPVEVYLDVEHARREVAMFRRLPMLAALGCQVPDPGDFTAVTLLGTPLLIVRDHGGEVKVFHNACRHRGMKLAEGSGSAEKITCPYHAWSYRFDGALAGVPRGRQGFPELDHERRGLAPVTSVESHGIIWVRLDGAGPIDIDAHLGEFGPELASWQLDTWHFAESKVHQARANWKLALEGYMENYHVEFLHRGSLDQIAKSLGGSHVSFGDHQRMVFPNHPIDVLRDLPKQQWKPLESGAISFILHLFPGTIFALFFDHFEVFQILPGPTPDTSTTIQNFYTPHAVPESARPGLLERFQFVYDLLSAEDYMAVQRCHETLASGANRTLVFGRQEIALHALHDSCGKHLAGESA